MQYLERVNRHQLRFCGLLLVICLLFAAFPAAAHADGPAIPTFYSATRASYDAWKGTDTQPPPRTASFAAGTKIIAFYFEFTGAAAKSTTFQLTILDGKGNVFLNGSVHKFGSQAGSEMLSEDNGSAYPNGSYQAQVAINDVVAAQASFVVGSAAVSITRAYMISSQAYDTWDPNSSQDPPASTTFATGTTRYGIFFTYTHAKAGSDSFQLLLLDPSGRQIGTGTVHKFRYDSGTEALLLPVSANAPPPGNGYLARLLVNGVPAVRLAWSVAGGVGAVPTPVQTLSPGSVIPVRHCFAADLPAVVRCVEPSVLRISVRLSDGEAQGTGFVVRVDGTGTYLLTNRHVVEGGKAATMKVFAPNGTDSMPVLAVLANDGKPGTAGDLAVIKLAPSKLRPLAWGSSEKLSVGQTVASIGYGLAFELSGPPSVTEGIVSAVHRDLGDSYGQVWIQHQSTINHGNSGGPLLDLHGDVVGVNTLSIDQLPGQSSGGPEPVQGIFFAIPSNMAESVAVKLIGQLENVAPVKAVQPPSPSSSLFVGKHFAINLPHSWLSSKLNSKDPLFLSSDQLVQVSVGAFAANAKHASRTQLIQLAKDTATGFGKVKRTTVSDVTTGSLTGVLYGADFSDSASHLDVFMVQNSANTYILLVARVVAPGATTSDLKQSASMIASLRVTR